MSRSCDDPKCSLTEPCGAGYFEFVKCVGMCPGACKSCPNFGQCVQDCACECRLTAATRNGPTLQTSTSQDCLIPYPSTCPIPYPK
jgi:hypothetical protein